MEKTYLSVDLDFWGDPRTHHRRTSCERFFDRLLQLDVPILIVRDHQLLLADVNTSSCRRLEHVDYHSDLTDFMSKLPPKDGNWLNFVHWREQGRLFWHPPDRRCYLNGNVSHPFGWGTCYHSCDPWREPVTGWAQTRVRAGLRTLPWSIIGRVGVALSPLYWHDERVYKTVLPKLFGVETFQDALREMRHLSPEGKRLR